MPHDSNVRIPPSKNKLIPIHTELEPLPESSFIPFEGKIEPLPEGCGFVPLNGKIEPLSDRTEFS